MKAEGEEVKTLKRERKENYRACMVLAGVGDAMGYKNGQWEFLTNSKILHDEMMKLTNQKGPLYLEIDMAWRYSDDTVMHIATAEAILAVKEKQVGIEKYGVELGKKYKDCWKRMSGRAPGKTTGKSIKVLNQSGDNWNKIPFNTRAYGCGASMRAACIGLAFHHDEDRLVAVSIESGRMTHHNPVGYLGALGASYFTALALRGVPPNQWIGLFLTVAIPMARKYIEQVGREVKENLSEDWNKFVKGVQFYGEKRKLSLDCKEFTGPVFPAEYGVIEREHFYKSLAWNGWPGALGIDSLLIAYDAFMSSNGSWEEICLRGILHGGDNDSTGTIAGAWFGASYGFEGVPKRHYQKLEDVHKLEGLGDRLLQFVRK